MTAVAAVQSPSVAAVACGADGIVVGTAAIESPTALLRLLRDVRAGLDG